jgi:hypothetical protein
LIELNIEKKLGRFKSGFTFPLKYDELEKRHGHVLSRKGWLLYTALLRKALTAESPVITFSIPEGERAELSPKTLKRCREELETRRLIAVTRESADKPFHYELLHPTNGRQLQRSVQRKKITAELSKRYPARTYTPDETFKVFEILIGDRLQGSNTRDGFEPRGDNSHRYLCPFHIPNLEYPDPDRKSVRAPLLVFADTGYWACSYKHCTHSLEATLRERNGDGYLLHFVRAYKWQLDASRYKKAYNLTSAQIREVIAQILDGASCWADLTYTTQNIETRELIQARFDSRTPQPVKLELSHFVEPAYEF